MRKNNLQNTQFAGNPINFAPRHCIQTQISSLKMKFLKTCYMRKKNIGDR